MTRHELRRAHGVCIACGGSARGQYCNPHRLRRNAQQRARTERNRERVLEQKRRCEARRSRAMKESGVCIGCAGKNGSRFMRCLKCRLKQRAQARANMAARVAAKGAGQ